jgi:two-component system response regulator PilR (NtrC family)
MNPAGMLRKHFEGLLKKRFAVDFECAAERSTVLIVTADPEIRGGLRELFRAFSLNAIWSNGIEAAKNVLGSERISACLCGFWLQDGTYRELVRHIRCQRPEVPLIIVSAPGCPQGYGDYLAAMNIKALNFLPYPYRKSDLEEMLPLATDLRAIHPPAAISPVCPD